MKRSIFISAIGTLFLAVALAGCGASVEAGSGSGDGQQQQQNTGGAGDLTQTGQEKTNTDLLISTDSEHPTENMIVIESIQGDVWAGKWDYAPAATTQLLNGGYSILAKGCGATDIETNFIWGEFDAEGNMVDSVPFSISEKTTAEAGKKYGLLVTLKGIKNCKRLVVKAVALKG